MQSSRSGPLEGILAKYDWITTFTHPPDVDSLLRTNEALSSLQSPLLKASLADLTTPLTELQSDLKFLCNAVVSLETQMSRVQSLKHDYETALSPIRHLPMEVLAEILCCSWKDDDRVTYDLGDGPWSLGQVCRSWRNAIESFCPKLWATLDIGCNDLDGAKRPMKGDPVEMLRVVLERSRNHPLDFHLWVTDKATERCLDLLITHSKRWSGVTLGIPSSLLPRLSAIRGRIDLLRRVDLDCFPSGSLSEDSDIWAFEIAPKLENLRMSCLPPDVNIPFPATNLVSFFDARPFAGDRLLPKYFDIVKAAPGLRSFLYIDCGVNLMSTSALLPCVTSLSIEKFWVSSPSCMRSMKLPSLTEVTLTTMYDDDLDTQHSGGDELIKCPVDALGALHQMLLQSQCSLYRLHLIDAVLDNNLANIIRLTPSLRRLVIELNEWVEDYDPILDSLVAQMSEECLVDGAMQHCVVPSLQELGIYLSNIDDAYMSFIGSTFVDMVASRVRRPCEAPRLMKLCLSISGSGWIHDLDEVAENTLKSLKHEGLQLTYNMYDADMSE